MKGLAYIACCAVAAGLELQSFAAVRCVASVPYDKAIGEYGLGDLYLPESMGSAVDVLLLIHGGGWTALDRHSMDGVAEFFARELGFAVFNIEYRKASAKSPWPACGDDCLKAARFVLSGGLARGQGVGCGRLWICGASAGGHLALWTLTHLPPEKVAGVISISSIGDPEPFLKRHEDIRRALLPNGGSDGALDPRPFVRPGMAPALFTHADEDEVVPIGSHRAFADSYRAAGNSVDFFSYSQDVYEGLTGHCIWLPGVQPHRLIPKIERRIGRFVTAVRRGVERK